MNIFKVLASGKFSEEESSAMLAWLLNPYMEHGLGFAFLRKFIERVIKSNEAYQKANEEHWANLDQVLQPVLRLDRQDKNKLEFRIDLEYNVGSAFIDIVLKINDFVFAIENKIRAKSANKAQLRQQYDGLLNDEECKKATKRFIVFLVPSSMTHEKAVDTEFDNLTPNAGDEKIELGWEEDVRPIIQELLDEDQRAEGEVLTEYLRHTLKAFSSFIREGFEGYDFEKSGQTGPNAEGEGTYAFIKKSDPATAAWIGCKYGIAGLLRTEKSVLAHRAFQYTSKGTGLNSNWMSRAVFLQLMDCIQQGNFDAIKWEDFVGDGLLSTLPSETIYRIAKATATPLFIGIQGGLAALDRMGNETIRTKSWGMATKLGPHCKPKQWIPKDDFIRVVEEKKGFPAVSA